MEKGWKIDDVSPCFTVFSLCFHCVFHVSGPFRASKDGQMPRAAGDVAGWQAGILAETP